jgi:diguanylate cyclase (GGDEF)-like protein
MRKQRRAKPRQPQPLAQVHYVESAFNRLSYYDPLTRLPNRGLLQDRLDLALLASARSGMLGALYCINVKNFRGLNGAEGHAAGDLLLVQLAARLGAVVRDCDTVARQWGDEFLILVEDLADNSAEAAHHARLLGERLCAALLPPVDLGTHLYACHLHIGISLFGPTDTVDGVFKQAALALDQSYVPGAHCLCFFDPEMQSSQDRRDTLGAEMEKALLWQQFRIYYQPQLDQALRVVGVEALLRWQHPLRGLVPPGEFIPLAEDTDLIIPIGHWVLKSACEQLKRWEYLPCCSALQVAVNVSVRQFQQPDFVAQVQPVAGLGHHFPVGLGL